MSQTELIPNCLLTKAPVIFLSARAWNGTDARDYVYAKYLFDHGYEVIFRPLPFGFRFLRRDLVRRLVSARPVHVILEKELLGECADLFRDHPPQSITTYETKADTADTKSRLLSELRARAEEEWSTVLAKPSEGAA